MKKLAFFFAMLSIAWTGVAQTTGSGVVLQTDSPYAFTPTTVDSTAVFEVELTNTVGVAQTVYFGGLEAPFSIDPSTPQEVPANSSINLTISFNPTEIGSFEDELEVLGDVFGSANLALSGQGIQVILDWTPTDLSFETTAIGQQSSATVTVTSSGDGAGTISDVVFSNSIFSLDEANSTLSIDEGTSGDLTFLFSPTGAGVFNETVELYTNDPNNSVITIPLTATGISEVSGEVCDVTWSLTDSPFTLVGDVTVPEGCSLTIEPGVIVEMNGFDFVFDGELIAQGTSENPIISTGGDMEFGPGNPTLISHLHYTSGDGTTPYELLYYNNFESTNGQYDFDCEVPDQNYYSGTGTTTSWAYGCNSWYRNSGSSWSYQANSGDHALYWYAYDYDGYIYLANPPTASNGGVYEVSFGYESDRFERDCRLEIEFLDDGNWTTYWTSPYDVESRSDFNRIAKASKHFEPGETIDFRIRANLGNTNSSYDDMYTHIDEFRIERKRAKKNEVEWIMENNTQDFLSLSNSWGDTEFWYENDTIHFRSLDGTNDFYTDSWTNAPIIVPESGWYVLEADYRSTKAEDYCDHYVRYKSSFDGSWRYMIENQNRYSTSVGAYLYDWHTESIYSYEYFTEGSRIDFHLYSYVYTSSSSGDEMDWDITGFRIYQLEDEAADFSVPLFTQRAIQLDESHGGKILTSQDLSVSNSVISQIDTEGEVLNVNSSSIGNIAAQTDSITLTNSSAEAVEIQTGSLVLQSATVNSISAEQSAEITLTNSEVINSEGAGITMTGDTSTLTLSFATISGHDSHGINILSNQGQLNMTNSIVSNNSGDGINSNITSHLNYATITQNEGMGWDAGTAGSSMESIITNSIISNNDDGAFDASVLLHEYNYIGNYPQFEEGSYMLEAYSPCVDAAMPWNTDQNMPFGMGGLRADMGAYGGPNNAGWGGSPAPDGAATLQAVSDSPQDQGYVLGLTFDASAFDNSIITDNISHYAVWRHYDPTGESIASLDDGNWELLGTMPAQGFSGYAYQAEALGNTNDFGSFTSCYTVVAHTDNEDVYWYSNVMCGEAVDNLAPEDPDLNGLVLETGEAQLSWPTPAEEDYAYTEIFSDAGFSAEVGADTLVVDNTVLAGNSYTYTAVHYDVNGNASDAVSLTLDISAGLDVINLNAGWNLISIDRSLSDGDIETLFSGLQSNNLQYVTGFQNGVQFYDPNGLSFLNTMSSVDNGYGYWVKVAEDDVLEVGGSSLPVNYRPELNAGWNLIGYPNAEDSDPADYFADLIADDNLVYATGFDEGSQVFDPNGLAFLNTLQELENGFGYWVKTLVGEDLNGLTTSDTKRNPSYMVLNGASSLTAAGETVDVLNASGEVVAQMAILEGGFLMTTAVFGADPSDENAFGLELGETLSFAFNGRLADQTIEWQGGMEHRALNLTFGNAAEALTLAPNPAQDQTWLTFQLDRDAAVSVQVTDALGRVVMQQPLGTLTQGDQQHALSLLGMAPGVYEVAVMSDGSVAATARLLMQK